MNEQKYNILRLVGLIITAVIFIGHYFIPEKRLVVHPSNETDSKLYGYVNPINGSSGSWISKVDHSMQCNYQPEDKYGCGFLIYYTQDPTKGIDLRAYEGLLIDLNYEGSSKIIRVYIRNFNEAYSNKEDGDSNKFLSMILQVKEIGVDPIYISLSEFNVAEWWLNQKKIRRQFSHYEVDNIINFGVDYIEPGIHSLRINSIVLVGRQIKTKTLLFYFLFFWMGIFLIEGFLRFYSLYKKSQKDKSLVNKLKDNQHSLEIEREKFRILSSTDPLTGVYNRAGITQHFHNLFFDPDNPPDFGILLFDIDHFKKINDTSGHDIGDQVLKSFARTITNNMRTEDFFARWGGEEFILVTPKTTPENLLFLAEKLRKLVEKQRFIPQLGLRITISVGATLARPEDIFEDAFKRADDALYRAKNEGRNRSRYEG